MSIKDTYIEAIKRDFGATPYAKWLEDEGVAVHEGFSVEDVRELELAPWPRIGGNAVFINMYSFMEGGQGVYFAEIPGGKTLEPERWCCQKIVFIEEGTGTTEVWQQGSSRKHVFEWGKGSIFAIPINAWHRMHNLGSQPAQFLVMTTAPLVMKGFHDANFIFTCEHVFSDMYSGEDDRYFAETNNRRASDILGGGRGSIWETNFIRDAWGAHLDGSAKAYGGASSGFRMANKTFTGHVAEWPVGSYHQAHYHDPGRLLHPLTSEGFVMIWSNKLGPRPFEAGYGDDVVVEPWKAGGMYSPPGGWYHAHFNTGPEPARQLAFYGRSGFEFIGDQVNAQAFSLIRYPDEDPEVRRLFKAELDKKGIPFDMPESLFEQGAPLVR